MRPAELFVDLLMLYGTVGAIFAVAFVTAGIHRVDRAAEQAPVGFRLIVLPGAAALWPWLLVRWIRSAGL